jgi:N-acetylmuramic acid 6-phosphate etherase
MAMRELILPILTSLSPTECRNPKSKNLDKMPIQSAIDLWLDEERAFYNEIAKEKPALERVIRRVTLAFQNGGRLFYVGSGTSGRLGILDASECPPTFKSPPHWVQGIISGGTKAIQESVEGAEDSTLGGMLAIKERRVNSKDVVFGIAASGRTPYVWGALHQAKELGAFTVFLGFNPFLTLKHKPDEVMLIHAGPEILTGSTRLKSGSATKCVLNIVTTLAMVQYGKCVENLMVDLNPSNEKLKERSLRIVLTIINPEGKKDHVSLEKAKEILLKNNYDIKRTVAELKN